MKNLCKVVFRLAQDEFGYPPSETESVWAWQLPNGNYKINNIPIYVRGISSEHEISVEKVNDGIYFRELVVPSMNSTFRLLLSDGERCEEIRSDLVALGCLVEIHRNVGLLAVEIPSSVLIEPFLEFIVSAQELGELDIEEGALRHTISS